MIDLPEILKRTAVDCLLEEDNLSVRYFILRDVLGKNENDSSIESETRAFNTKKKFSRI